MHKRNGGYSTVAPGIAKFKVDPEAWVWESIHAARVHNYGYRSGQGHAGVVKPTFESQDAVGLVTIHVLSGLRI